MATNTLQVNFQEHFKSELDASDGVNEKIQLTPYLSLACALLYMASSDGELGVHESSHLQSVLGGDEEVLRYGVRFVQTVSFDGFLIDAPELLSTKDKWCILANVCDALLSDGHAAEAELALFARLRQAFGVTEKQFEPFFKIFALKNDKSLLGRYAGVREDRQPMTPHLALASALLYMLTSDGSIGAQEIGQLESVIGEFEDLQKVALSYVRTVKMKAFLDEASAVLKPEQKLYILTNVCDSMLADGEVANIEDKLFLSMLHSFGYNEASFARFYQVLETKSVKPFDTSQFKNRVKHERQAGSDDGEGVTFNNELSAPNLAGAEATAQAASQQGAWQVGAAELEMNQFIARQMQDNKQSLSKDFNGQANIAMVEKNALDGLNLQQIEDLQSDANWQQVDVSESLANKQLIDSGGPDLNVQDVGVDVLKAHREVLDPEVRAQNIQEVVEKVNKRLDHFESKNYGFLQVGRAQKFTDDFVLVEEDALPVNRQLLEASFSRMGGVAHSFRSDEKPVITDEALTPLHDVQAEVVGRSTVSTQNNSFIKLSPASLKTSAEDHLLRGSAQLSKRRFAMPYKQIALALAAMVFASPIYTRPAQGRMSSGPLVMIDQSESDGARPTLDVERIASLQVQ
jgi:uncharacterized tellurite resistance protein B-like protein